MKNKKDEMVWSKELGFYLLPKNEVKGLKVCLHKKNAHTLERNVGY